MEFPYCAENVYLKKLLAVVTFGELFYNILIVLFLKKKTKKRQTYVILIVDGF